MAELQPQGEMRALRDEEPRHEMSDVSVKGIFFFGAILAIVCIAAQFGLKLMMDHYEKEEAKNKALTPTLLTTPADFAGPRLQPDPGAERTAYQKQAVEWLNGYGWVDRKAGIGHIPIDRAMDLLVRKGLPDIKEAPKAFARPAFPIRPPGTGRSQATSAKNGAEGRKP